MSKVTLPNQVQCAFTETGVLTTFADGATYFGEVHYTPEHTRRTSELGLLLNVYQTWLHEWLHSWLRRFFHPSDGVIWKLAHNEPVDQDAADHEEPGVIAFQRYMRLNDWSPAINQFTDYQQWAITANREFERILWAGR